MIENYEQVLYFWKKVLKLSSCSNAHNKKQNEILLVHLEHKRSPTNVNRKLETLIHLA